MLKPTDSGIGLKVPSLRWCRGYRRERPPLPEVALERKDIFNIKILWLWIQHFTCGIFVYGDSSTGDKEFLGTAIIFKDGNNTRFQDSQCWYMGRENTKTSAEGWNIYLFHRNVVVQNLTRPKFSVLLCYFTMVWLIDTWEGAANVRDIEEASAYPRTWQAWAKRPEKSRSAERVNAILLNMICKP